MIFKPLTENKRQLPPEEEEEDDDDDDAVDAVDDDDDDDDDVALNKLRHRWHLSSDDGIFGNRFEFFQ